jgi:hypothetical protein
LWAPGLSRVTPGFRDGVLFGRCPTVEAMTDTEANKKILDEFTQGLFSEGDLEATDEYLSVELVIHDPGSAPASARRGAAIGLGDELRAAVWAGVCRCVLCLYRADCSRSVSA